MKKLIPSRRDTYALLAALALPPIVISIGLTIGGGAATGIFWLLSCFLIPFATCLLAQRWIVFVGLVTNSVLAVAFIYQDSHFHELLWAYLHRNLTSIETGQLIVIVGMLPLAQFLSLWISLPLRIKRQISN